MEYRGIEYSVVQGIRRNLWKWSASVANVGITGQSHSKSEAVSKPRRRLIGRSLRKRCGLSRCLDAGIDRRSYLVSIGAIKGRRADVPLRSVGLGAIRGLHFFCFVLKFAVSIALGGACP